jgi:hypothetical protein
MLALMPLQTTPWSELFPRLTELGISLEHGAFSLLVALVVLLVGWGLGALLSRVVRSLLHALKVDEAAQNVLGARAAPRHAPSAMVAWALYWAVIACAAMVAFELLGFHLAISVADRLGEVIPRIVTSAILFAIGSLIALLVGSLTRRFLESAEIRIARLQGQIVTAVLTGFAALLALEQLGFAAQFVVAIGIVAVATAGLGLALAFGLGCRDIARDFLVEYLRSLEDQGPKRPD